MSAMDELGLTKEKFSEIYKRLSGEFCELVSPPDEDDFGAFLERGSRKIVEENSDLIDKMVAARS